MMNIKLSATALQPPAGPVAGYVCTSLVPRSCFLYCNARSKTRPGIHCMGDSEHAQLSSPESGEFVHPSKTFVNVYCKLVCLLGIYSVIILIGVN